MTEATREAQKLQLSARISLFTLDTTSVGGSVYHFVMARESSSSVQFDGVTYTPVDIEFDDLETNGVGSLPTPRLRVANTNGFVQAILNTWGDLCGCTLTRIRTFERFLDGHEDADPTAIFGPDIYKINQKTTDTPKEVEWELSSPFDQENKYLPGRVVVRDTCLWRYRQWNPDTEEFDYSKALCPYTGAQSYDVNDQPVDDQYDRPSRRLSCCKTRFGDDVPLPFGGFPGARVSTQ